jgi:hypothetical protein
MKRALYYGYVIAFTACCVHAVSAMESKTGILYGFPGDDYPPKHTIEELLPVSSRPPSPSKLYTFKKGLRKYGPALLALTTLGAGITIGYFARNQIIQGVSDLQKGSDEMNQACTQTRQMCTAATQVCQGFIGDMNQAGLLAKNCSTLIINSLSKCPMQAYALVKCLDS